MASDRRCNKISLFSRIILNKNSLQNYHTTVNITNKLHSWVMLMHKTIWVLCAQMVEVLKAI